MGNYLLVLLAWFCIAGELLTTASLSIKPIQKVGASAIFSHFAVGAYLQFLMLSE